MVFCIRAETASTGLHVQAQNFPRLAFRDDFHRTAADFAIRGEALKSAAGVHHHFKTLAAIRALNCFGNFHKSILLPCPDSAINPFVSLFAAWPRKASCGLIGM